MVKKIATGLLLFFLSLSSFAHQCEQINSDESMLFYPTTARRVTSHTGKTYWEIPVHVQVFEWEKNSVWRSFLISYLSYFLGVESSEISGELFERRFRYFLVDNESHKELKVKIGPKVYELNRTGSNGHSKTTLFVPTNDIKNEQEVIQIRLANEDLKDCPFQGYAFPVQEYGVTIVSDIDDTIKISNVLNKVALVKGALLKPYSAVPGMSELYQKWKKEKRASSFYYLSGSPWQLFNPLHEFMQKQQFPLGELDLKLFRVWDESILNLVSSQKEYKLKKLLKFASRFPNRQFVLVGDSTEQDPEVYGELARQIPHRVEAIYIRQVPSDLSETEHKERYSKAFNGVQVPWQVFRESDELLN